MNEWVGLDIFIRGVSSRVCNALTGMQNVWVAFDVRTSPWRHMWSQRGGAWWYSLPELLPWLHREQNTPSPWHHLRIHFAQCLHQQASSHSLLRSVEVHLWSALGHCDGNTTCYGFLSSSAVKHIQASVMETILQSPEREDHLEVLLSSHEGKRSHRFGLVSMLGFCFGPKKQTEKPDNESLSVCWSQFPNHTTKRMMWADESLWFGIPSSVHR